VVMRGSELGLGIVLFSMKDLGISFSSVKIFWRKIEFPTEIILPHLFDITFGLTRLSTRCHNKVGQSTILTTVVIFI
jgi:hypothetical protein